MPAMGSPPARDLEQSFTVQRSPHDAMEAAAAYLEGAGTVSARMRGRLERYGDELVVHHGRIRTTVSAQPTDRGTRMEVRRAGPEPLAETRGWLYGLGLGGFLVAWALSWYNERAQSALPPLVTITFFFLGLLAVVVGLYVMDRSLERRSRSLVLSLEDAVRGDPLLVLQREVTALQRSAALANALLFYCAALVVELLVFVVLLSDEVRPAIDEAVTLDVMRWGFTLPIAPAVAFGLVLWGVQARVHQARLGLVERRLRPSAPDAPGPADVP